MAETKDEFYARLQAAKDALFATPATRIAMGDGIEARLTNWAHIAPRPPAIRIGDDLYVFPEGTTNEQAQSVLDEAKRRYLMMGHDPGDEDRSER